MEIEIKKLMKLKVTEQNLAALLQKIDNEINQTDIQWMHLKSLIPLGQKEPAAGPSKTDIIPPKPKVAPPQHVKQEHHIDDQSVNETQLVLSLGNNNMDEESGSEEDSD